jgi:hypothetical protein
MGLRDWLRRVFGRAKPIVDPRIEEMLKRHRIAVANGWWRDMTGLVSKTDKQLVVIGPGSIVTAEDLQALGQALRRWQAEFPQARHIWGLTDLLDGKFPRTPPIYLSVPYPSDKFEECYESVALVYVAQGTDLKAAIVNLYDKLIDFHNKLGWFDTPDVYSLRNR